LVQKLYFLCILHLFFRFPFYFPFSFYLSPFILFSVAFSPFVPAPFSYFYGYSAREISFLTPVAGMSSEEMLSDIFCERVLCRSTGAQRSTHSPNLSPSLTLPCSSYRYFRPTLDKQLEIQHRCQLVGQL
jgi:hypothetical protein